MKYEDIVVSGSINISGSFTVPVHANSSSATQEEGSVYHDSTDTTLKIYSGSAFTNVATQPYIPIPSANIEYLVVAGGGAGGGGNRYTNGGGGGGAGGLLSSSLSSIESGSSITVTIGAGGTGTTGNGTDGGDSSIASSAGTSFTTATATGGGAGGTETSGPGSDGGSGGGATRQGGAQSGGSGTAGQGNDGGDVSDFNQVGGAGGGGAAAEGEDLGSGTNQRGGDGGDGKQSSITGTATYYAGGGGGGTYQNNSSDPGSGGQGGGGNGNSNGTGTTGTANTGGGGGGSGNFSAGYSGGSGGSGVVILAYPSSSINAAGGIVGDAGNGRKYHQFNSSGTFKVGSSTDFQIVSDNLLLHFDAGDFRSRGASTITDISTNTNNGTVSGATLGQNWWYDFDGSNDYITAPPTSYVSSGYSIEFWIYKDAINTSYDCIYAAGYGLQIYWTNDDIELYIATTDGGSYVVNGTAITGLSATTWVHAVITDDGSGNVVMYEDGTQSTTATYSGTPYVYTGTPRIGDYAPSAGSYPLDGRISQFRIYSDALTAAEVLQNYNATKTNFV